MVNLKEYKKEYRENNKEFILEKINQGKTSSDFVNALKNEFGIEVSLASFRGYLKKLKNPEIALPVKQNASNSTLSLNKKDVVTHEGET